MNPFDQFDQAGEGENPFNQFDAATEKPKKQNKGILSDLGTDVKRGVQQIPGAITGLADIPVAGITGRAYLTEGADALGGITGFKPGQWAKDAEAEYSPQRQAGRAEINKAWEDGTASDIAGAYLKNPMNTVGAIAESVPSMLVGGIAGRAALGIGAQAATKAAPAIPGMIARTVGEKMAPAVAAGIGEGGVMAGQAMQNSLDAGVDPREAAAYAAGTGIVGGAIGALGGSVAQRMGIIDPDIAMVGGKLLKDAPSATGRFAGAKALAKRTIGGGIAEGVLEELPQSVMEQGLSNLAQGKPLTEGVTRAGVEGALAGFGMGAAFNALPGAKYAQTKLQERPPEDGGAPIAGLLPAPVYPGTPGDQIIKVDAERQAAVAAADANAAKLYAERDAFEREAAMRRLQEGGVRFVSDPNPIQDHINDLLSIGRKPMTKAESEKYAKALTAAFNEPIGIKLDANQIEVPFTMGEYLDAQVRAGDEQRAIPLRTGANEQAGSRLTQLADEEAMQQPDIQSLPARQSITAAPAPQAPAIPVVGPLSAAANVAVQTGAAAPVQSITQPPAQAIAPQAQPVAAQTAAAEVTDDMRLDGKRAAYAANAATGAPDDVTSSVVMKWQRKTNERGEPMNIWRSASGALGLLPANQKSPFVNGELLGTMHPDKSTQPTIAGQQQKAAPAPVNAGPIQSAVSTVAPAAPAAPAQGSSFEGRTDAQLNFLAMNGRTPEIKASAAAELQRRGIVIAAPQASAPTQAAPEQSSGEIRRGKVGGKLTSGEVVLTSSGRSTTPFPKVSAGGNAATTKMLKAVDRWLMENAASEAESRGDKFNASQFSANAQKPQQADKDSAEEYLFGQQPEVPRPFLKPLVNDASRAANIERLQAELAAATPMERHESDVIGRLITAVIEDATKSIDAGSPPAYTTGNGTFMVIHPSAQNPGMVQVTRYAENGVFGDSQYNNIEEAIRDNGVWMKRRMTEAEAIAALDASAKAEADYQKRKQEPAKPKKSGISIVKSAAASPIAKRDDLVGAIIRVTGGAGIHSKMAQTIVGDKANAATKVRGLFSLRGQEDLGDIADLLRVQEGYDVRDGDHLSELIREQAAGNPVYSMERTEREAAENVEKEYRSDIRRRAAALGIRTAVRKFDDVERDVLEAETKQAQDEAQAERDAIQAADAVEELSDDQIDALIDLAAQETKERGRYINEEWITDEQILDAFEPVGESEDEQGADGAGQADAGEAGGNRQERGQEARPDFGLANQTNAQAADQFAQQQAVDPAAPTKEQADRERDAVPFSLGMQSQPKPQGVQTGLFTADGRASVAATQEQGAQKVATNKVGVFYSISDAEKALVGKPVGNWAVFIAGGEGNLFADTGPTTKIALYSVGNGKYAGGTSSDNLQTAIENAVTEAKERFGIDLSGMLDAGQESRQEAKPQRGEIGASLTKEERKSVLKTLVDVYRQKKAPREMKGVDANGNERYGYVHSPELFEKSDITGAMVRYHVTLPDGRIAHPTELFSDYTQADIDAAMQKEIDAGRLAEAGKKSRAEKIDRTANADLNEARAAIGKLYRSIGKQIPERFVEFYSEAEGKWIVIEDKEVAGRYKDELAAKGYREVATYSNEAGPNQRAIWKPKSYVGDPVAQPKQPNEGNAKLLPALEEIASRLGITIEKVRGGYHASSDGKMVSVPEDDKNAEAALSANHILAHELGHAVIARRGMNFSGIPIGAITKTYVPNWIEFVGASKSFRPGVWNHTNEKIRKHANKPSEILADAIASVLMGSKPVSMLKQFMENTGTTLSDLGLQSVEEANAEYAKQKQADAAHPKAEPADTGAKVASGKPEGGKRTKFSDLNVGDRFNTGKSKGVGINSDKLSWVDWEKISPSQAKVVEVHGAFEGRIVGTVDNFGAGSSVFSSDQKQEAEPAKAEDDWLNQLFDQSPSAEQTSKESAESVNAAQEKAGRVDAAIAMLSGEIEANNAAAAELAARKYKANRKQIELKGDGPGRNGSMSISAINESRKRRAIEASLNASSAIKKAIEFISENPDSAFKQVLDMESAVTKQFNEGFFGKSAKLDDKLDMAVGSMIGAGSYSGNGSAGRKLRMAAHAYFAPDMSEPADAKAPADVPGWFTDIPETGVPLTQDQIAKKPTAYQAVVGLLAQEAWKSISQNQRTSMIGLYAYVKPAAPGYNGIVRLFPEDQTPPAPWSLLDPQIIRQGGMTKEQGEAHLRSILGRAPVIGEPVDEKAKPATAVTKTTQELIEAEKAKLRAATTDDQKEIHEKEISRLRRIAAQEFEPAQEKAPEPPRNKYLSREEIEALAAKHGNHYAAGYSAQVKGYSIEPPSNLRSEKSKNEYRDGWMAAAAAVDANKEPETKAAEQEAKSAEKIEDFGEKIAGAKKDLWQSYKKAMSDELPADAKDITLSKHFPEPDYENLIASGIDIRAVAAIKAMRDEIPAKPRQPFKLRRWAEQLRTLRDFSNGLISGDFKIDRVLSLMRSGRLSTIADRIEMYAELGYPAFKSADGYSVSGGWSTDFDDKGSPRKKDAWAILNRNSIVGAYDSRDMAMQALRERLAVEPEKSERSSKLDLYKVTSTGDIVIGKKVASNKFIDLKTGFKSAREARAYLNEHEAELLQLLEQRKKFLPTRRSTNDPRVGKDYRLGEDVTPEKFASEFGFRGVQFGNYVERARRVKDLNNAYDALLDLANIIGVPPRAISLNGSLGLAFGARGKGGVDPAAAHYESDETVINLTKISGAGSLGHEFFHALDNYFSKKRGQPDSYLTANQRMNGDGIRPEVVQAFASLMKTIKSSDFYKRSIGKDKTRSKDYWSTSEELAARAFESYLIAKAEEKGESNDYLANIISEEAQSVYNEMLAESGMDADPYPYPTKEEQKTINAAFDNLFSTLETKETGKGIALTEERAVYDVNEPGAFTGDIFQGTEHALPEAKGRAAPAGRQKRGRDENRQGASRVLAVRESETAPGTYNVTTQLVTVGERKLPVATVKTSEDAARAFAHLSRYAVEHFDGLVTDKNGKPLAVIGSFKGDPRQTSVYPSTVMMELSRIKGAANLWMSHNHPSGKADLSGADKMLSSTFRNILRDTNISYRGLSAIARRGDEITWTDDDYNNGSVSINEPTPYSVPIVEREIVESRPGDMLSSPTDAKRIVSALAKDSPGVVFATAQNEVGSFIPFSPEEMGNLRSGDRLMRLFGAAAKSGATTAIIAMPDGKVSDLQFANIRAALMTIEIGVLDGIKYDSKTGQAAASVAETIPGPPDVRSFGNLADDDVFFSQLHRQIEAAPDRLFNTGPQFKMWLAANRAKLGIKLEEVEWSGINEWLDLQGKGKITKQQVVDFVAQNGVKVEEVIKGADKVRVNLTWDQATDDLLTAKLPNGNEVTIMRAYDDEPYRLAITQEDGEGVGEEQFFDTIQQAKDAAEGVVDAQGQNTETKFGEYTLPGGENYRELLLTLPAAQKPDITASQEEKDTWRTKADKEYRSAHWEEPNILAHIRMNDRTDADGNKVLFIEEVQSDWGQQGKKDGFKKPYAGSTPNITAKVLTVSEFVKERSMPDAAAKAWIDNKNAIRADLQQAPLGMGDYVTAIYENGIPKVVKDGALDAGREAEKWRNGYDRMIAQAKANHDRGESWKVATAPFVGDTKAWLSLALKRIMRYAADNGYAKVAFINGEQSADRYSLAKSVNEVSWRVRGGNKNATVSLKNGDDLTFHITPSGVVESVDGTGETTFVGKLISDVVGKEVADRILSSEKGRLEGDGLKIGGTGMKAFYDQIVPQVAGDLLKKMGGKMEAVRVGTGVANKTSDGLGFDTSEIQFKRDAAGNWGVEKNPDFVVGGKRLYWDGNNFVEDEGSARAFWNQAEAVASVMATKQPGFTVPAAASAALPLFSRAQAQNLSVADKAIYGMVSEGKSAADILKFIASASRNPFYRQLAKLLQKTGIAPRMVLDDQSGWKMNAGNDKRYAAAYNPKTDTVALFRAGAAERNVLHELTHAATIKALKKNGLAAAQMKALFNHVKNTGKLTGMYGVTDVDEFVAEAFSNPKFQDALKGIAAPPSSSLKSAWQWFVRVVRNILGVPANQESALIRALEIGVDVMRENAKIKAEAGGGTRYASGPAKQTETPEFKRWFGESKVVDSDGNPLVVYHGTASDITAFRLTRTGEFGPAIYTTADRNEAAEYGVGAGSMALSQAPVNVMPVYVSLQNPYTNGVEKFWPEFGRDDGDAAAVQRARDAGYDGVIATRPDWRNNVLTHYVAFDPTQIKSAIGNNGQFDPANPDIRYNVEDEGWSVSEPSNMDDMIYALQDKHIDTKRVIQAIAGAGRRIADAFNPYLKEELFHGRAAKGVKDFLDFELRPLLAEMNKAGVDMGDFEEFLWNRHAEERNRQIAKINPDMPDAGSGIKTADARAYMAGLPADQRAEFERLARLVDAINRKSQAILVQSGLEKPETINAWNAAYKKYVPLQREDVDSGHVGTGKGFSVRGSSSKRAMGSGRQVVDILANIAMQRERNVVRAEKNRVSNALLGLALENENKDFWTVDKAPKERVVKETAIYVVYDGAGNRVGDTTRMAEAERMARDAGGDFEQTWGDRVTERIEPGFKNKDNVILTRVNGEDHYITFNERNERAKRMAQALKNLDVDGLGRVLSAAGKATRYLASVNTQYNPVFGVINLVRDVQGALINLQSTELAGEQAKVLGYTKDALVGIYRDIRDHRAGRAPSSPWAQAFEEFQKAGGQTGYRDAYANAEQRAEAIKSELGQFSEGKSKKLARGLFGWLSDYNETMENAVRLAAYKVARDKGMSIEQAASIGKNLTVNFNRKGQVTQQVGALYAFFNASVQGTARIAQTLFETNTDGDPKKVRLSALGKKVVAGGVLLGAMQALLLAAAGYDDEPPEFVKERSLILPIGGGKYLSLAMPLGFHVLPGIGRIGMEFLMSGGKDPLKYAASLAAMMANTFNPLGSAGLSLQTITPSVVDPLAALAENKDFSGREIYRESFNAMNPETGNSRARDVATPWSRLISASINYLTGGSEYRPGMFSPSPDAIDYLIGQATGGVGRELGKASQTATAIATGEDLPLYKVPLAGRFIGDTEGKSGESQKFYNNVREINSLEREYKGLLKDQLKEEAISFAKENPGVRLILAGNAAENQVRKLRSMKRDLVDRGADRETVRAVEDKISQSMNRFNEQVKKAKEKAA